MSKTHKALPDRVWQERLKMFARNSVWPHDLGNKPAPRQKKWHTLYQKDLDTNKPPGLKVLPSPSVTTDCGLEALPATIQSVDSGSLITGHGDRPIRTPTVSAFTGHGDRPIRTPTVSAPIHAADTQFSALGQSGSASQDFHTTMDMTKMKGRQKSHTDPSTSEPKDSVIKNSSADAIDCKSVDSDNIPGFNHVDHLAGYLVDLRQQAGLSISNQQATEIIGLWGKLDAFDKDRIVYSARHQDKLRQGRFRSSKKTDVATPGVDSTKRCLIGASGSPAQWPNCSRLVESICIKLCSIYPSPKKREKVTFSRWTMILNDYKKLRQIVLGNGMVMENTTLQLVELNQNTLIQWHNKRQKAQELAVLLHGTNLPSACPVADQPLLSAKVRPCEALKVQHAEHMYRVPVNTAGQAKHKRPRMNPPANILPKNNQPPGISFSPRLLQFPCHFFLHRLSDKRIVSFFHLVVSRQSSMSARLVKLLPADPSKELIIEQSPLTDARNAETRGH